MFAPEIREYVATFVSNTGPNHICLWGLMKCKNLKSFRTGVDTKENKMLRIRDYLAIFMKNTERRRKIRVIFDIYSHCGGKY